MSQAIASQVVATSPSSRLVAAVMAAALGLTILFGVGFIAGPDAMAHNSAHDTRHAIAVPCH
jgi:cobalt transporter subunit CbtB